MRTKLGITKMLACLGVLTGCVGVSSLGAAAENCSGTWVQVGNATVNLNDDHSAPGHMAVGVCGWTSRCTLLDEDRSAPPQTGGGCDWAFRCTYKDGDGDTWTDESSPSQGKWHTVNGTGKYANAKSSGWSKVMKTEYGRPEGTIYVGVWGGQCSM